MYINITLCYIILYLLCYNIVHVILFCYMQQNSLYYNEIIMFYFVMNNIYVTLSLIYTSYYI